MPLFNSNPDDPLGAASRRLKARQAQQSPLFRLINGQKQTRSTPPPVYVRTPSSAGRKTRTVTPKQYRRPDSPPTPPRLRGPNSQYRRPDSPPTPARLRGAAGQYRRPDSPDANGNRPGNPRGPRIDFGSLFGAAKSVGDIVRGAQAGGLYGGSGVAGGAFANSGAGSYADILEQISQAMALDMPDADQMAADQFDPQFDLLSQLRSQTTGRMNQQSEDAKAMYDALAQSITEDKGDVSKEYDTAAQNLDAAFGGATDAIQNTSDSSVNEINAIMNRLGINAAAPDAVGNIAEDQARSLNTIAEMQANYGGANTANEQSMLDYLTTQSNTAGLAGANAAADVNLRLQEMLEGYDNKELELTAGREAAENEYEMQILGMEQAANNAASQQAMQQYQSMLDQERWQQEFQNDNWQWQQDHDWRRQTDEWANENARAEAERRAAEMEQEAARAAAESNAQGGSGGQAWDDVDASTAVMREAANIFGDPRMANIASNAIRETIANNPNITTMSQLLNAVGKRYPASNPNREEYLHLASIYGQAIGLR